jgi:tRNA wybutosine-synthesizing protein 1
MRLQKFKTAIPINDKLQVLPVQQKLLEKQGYRLVGHHSAVKICGWTKNLILNKGGCYKFAFYGIRSHQCLQMTTSMFCGSRCVFCWRGQKAPVSKEWYGPIDDPEAIIAHACDEHVGLLNGHKKNPKANLKLVEEMSKIKHVALSLTGEPITYPRLNELLASFHNKKISTFLVTNAQYPDLVEKIKYVTQLYLSIDAPNLELLKKVDNPLYEDFYDRMLKCLDVLKTRKYRTCIRLTLVKGLNMEDFRGYADLINRGSPDFTELKSYMHLGASKKRLTTSNMPTMDEVRDFTKQLLTFLPDYEFIQEHTPSRVCLLIKKSLKGEKWIDFAKFFDITNNNKKLERNHYNSKEMCPN